MIFSLLLPVVARGESLSQHGQHGSGSGTMGSTSNGQFNPFVCADPRGGFYILYVERVEQVSNLYLRHSLDGITFSAPVRVNEVPGQATVRNENPPKMIIGRQGELFVTWADEREKWKGNIHFARSIDGGRSFSPAVTLNSDASLPPVGHAFQSIAQDRNGRILVAWIDERSKTKSDRGAEIWMAVSEDRGQTFSPDRRIASDVCECCRTVMQIDQAGNIFIAYRTVPRTGKMLRDIVITRSSNGGKSFTPAIVSQDGWEINGCPVVGPGMTIDPNGVITLTWFVGVGERPGLYLAFSPDGGQSFSPRRLLIEEQRMAKHSHLVSLPDGRSIVVWDDAGVDGQTLTQWGVLGSGQSRQGDRSKPTVIGSKTGVSYPIVAVSGRLAMVTGLQPGKPEIFTRTFQIPK